MGENEWVEMWNIFRWQLTGENEVLEQKPVYKKIPWNFF
jgi:hypothetical protein